MTGHFDLKNDETKNRYVFQKNTFKITMLQHSPSIGKNIRFMPKNL